MQNNPLIICTRAKKKNVWEFIYCNQFKTTMLIHLYAFSE